MVDVVHVRAEPLTPEAFAPFGQVLAREPDEAVIGVRDGEEFTLNILSYRHRGLRVDHLNAHHRATQALFPLGRPQERVLPGLPWLRNGALLDAILDRMDGSQPVILLEEP